jgi:hypothetical protein
MVVGCQKIIKHNNIWILIKVIIILKKKKKNIFKSMGTPKNLNCDNEFNTKLLNEYFKDQNIRLYFSQPDEINKNAIVERFNRTLANLLQKWRIGTGKYDWNKVLPEIIDNYNNTYHSTLKETPLEIKNNKQRNQANIKIISVKFNIGDRVRTITSKSIFDKGDQNTFSKSIYTISKIEGNKIFITNDDGTELKRTFKDYELQKIDKVSKIQIDDSQENKHVNIQKERKHNKILKQVGIDQNNVVQTKRIKKSIIKLDL